MVSEKCNDVSVLFVVDSASLLYAARDRFGDRSRIDFVKLLNKARRSFSERPSLFIPVVYLFESQQGGGKSSLVAYLERIGFEVVLGASDSAVGGRNKSDFQVSEVVKNVTARLFHDKKEFSQVIFASNQEKLIEYAKWVSSQRGYKVRLLTFGGLDPSLCSAFEVSSLTSEVVFSDFKINA